MKKITDGLPIKEPEGTLVSWDILNAREEQYRAIKDKILTNILGLNYREESVKVLNNVYYFEVPSNEILETLKKIKVPLNIRLRYIILRCPSRPRIRG